MRSERNLHMHELVGLRLRVVQARDGGMIGMEGKVVDETRETLVVEDEDRRTIPKRGTVFEFTLEDGTRTALEGDSIAYRSEDRIKKARNPRRRASRREKGR